MSETTSTAKSELDLEWPQLLRQVASGCAGELAARALSSRRPADERSEALELMMRSKDAMEAVESGQPVPTGRVADCEDLFARVERGATASAPELYQVLVLLRSASEVRRYARAQSDLRSTLARALDSPSALASLEERFENALDEDGEVSDRASPDLRQARRRAQETRRELVRKLDQLIDRYAEVLRDRFYTERDGRYVLPVRSDAPFRMEGIVLGSSASGGTLYVEPRELTDLGNRLRMAVAAVDREVARVLTELSERMRASLADLRIAVKSCVEADVLAAIARWAHEFDATPLLPDEEHRMTLRRWRHPLLAESTREVVPIDLDLTSGHGLIVSGPNAGGKTVALKSIGLAALMVRSGIPLPVDPVSKIGWFCPVLTDVGDEQSLSRSLSTFSAHVKRLAEYFERSSQGSLVLLDEIAGGTDPDEGSALAVAVLQSLVERGAAVAVTTHYERLKDLGVRDPRFENASVGFDLDTMSPTFRLTMGRPGASSALAVARRFGMPDSVVTCAQALLPEGTTNREALLAKLESEQIKAEEARRSAERDAHLQAQRLEEIERERRGVREKERTRLEREMRELTAMIREARAKLREAEDRLRSEEPAKSALRDAHRLVNEAAKNTALGSPLDWATREKAPGGSPTQDASLAVGDWVHLNRLGRTAQVLAPPERGRLRVAAGSVKLTVALAEVSKIDRDPPPRERARPSRLSAPRVSLAPMRTPSNTCDVRGLRVDEAMDRIEGFVDRLIGCGEPAGFVLHGHGTGALKSAIRDRVGLLPYVARVRPAERDDGGDAFTVLHLTD